MSIKTPEIIKRLEQAALTLRASLGNGSPLLTSHAPNWPEIVEATARGALADQTAQRARPSMPELLAMAEAIEWLSLIDPDLAEIVWLKADGKRWKTISDRLMCLRHKLWRRWQYGLVQIAKAIRAGHRPEPLPSALLSALEAWASKP